MPFSFRRSARFALLLSLAAATPACAADKPDAQAAKKPRVLVTISKETTYITEPLRADGYPDYVAALNQRFREGVTPENNSAVLFWKAVGPSEIRKEDREKYFQMLGIPPLPEKGDYFVTSDAHVNRQKAANEPGGVQPEEEQHNPLWEQQILAMKRPWSKQEFPVWAEWLAANEKPLTLIIEASKRPRRYDPMLGGMVIAVLLPAAQQHRDVARALVARAMLRVHEGKTDEAWEDLMACHRLARLVGQGPTLVDALIAVTLDGVACQGDQALLHYAQLTAARVTKMRDDLNKLLPMPRMADKIDVTERFMYLDCVSICARKGLGSLDGLTGIREPKSIVQSLIESAAAATVDWDMSLRMGNSWIDRLADAYRKPTRTQRKEALHKVDEELKQIAKKSQDMTSLGLSILGNQRKAVSEQIGQVFVALLLPTLSACATVENRGNMQFELTKLAFTLAAYRADHGGYPAKLADLVPKYVAEVPKDIFNDAELHYRLEDNGYVLYSVGVNAKDDGAKSYGEGKEGENCDDLVVRTPATVKQEEKR